MTLWVDAWQLQCCGEPFRLGSPVAWMVREADPDWLQAVLGAEATAGVDGAGFWCPDRGGGGRWLDR